MRKIVIVIIAFVLIGCSRSGIMDGRKILAIHEAIPFMESKEERTYWGVLEKKDDGLEMNNYVVLSGRGDNHGGALLKGFLSEKYHKYLNNLKKGQSVWVLFRGKCVTYPMPHKNMGPTEGYMRRSSHPTRDPWGVLYDYEILSVKIDKTPKWTTPDIPRP